MEFPPQQTLRDYCRRIDTRHISLRFQPTNHVTFDIKNFLILGLKENSFNGKEIRDP